MSNVIATDVQTQEIDSALVELFEVTLPVSKKKIETSYGQAHFTTFSYEPKINVCE